MSKTTRLVFLFSFIVLTTQLNAQYVQASKEEIIALTPDWKGERFADGRPKVPDDIIRRMKPVTIEEAWALISGAGYRYQIAEGWGQFINPIAYWWAVRTPLRFCPDDPMYGRPSTQWERKKEGWL